MRKLLLASVAGRTLDYLKDLLEKDPRDCKVAFIPTAATPYTDKWFLDEDRVKLVDMGFTVFDFDLAGKGEEDVEEKLKNVDIVLVAGGNTFYLLDQVRKSGFDKVIKKLVESGAIYVGSSAGSVLAGPNIEAIAALEDFEYASILKDYEGLNLVDFVVVPHVDNPKFKDKCKQVIAKYATNYKYKLVPLKDNQAILVEGKNYRII